MSIKIIGAGFPRTGTNTLKRAFEILGYSKTYHFKDLLNDPSKLPYWEKLRDTKSTDWEKIYDGYQASVDFPCYPWYKEHMEKYPDAKVILTVRGFDGWYESIKKTIWVAGPQTGFEKIKMMTRMALNPELRESVKCIKFVKGYLWDTQFQGRFLDKDFVKTVWENHLQEVQNHVPKDRLLVFDARDGWEPLCNFLDKPIPNEPFPHLNKKENFKSMMEKFFSGEKFT